jgi:hypothetical protein
MGGFLILKQVVHAVDKVFARDKFQAFSENTGDKYKPSVSLPRKEKEETYKEFKKKK